MAQEYVTDQDQQLSQHVEYLPSGELWTDQTDSRFQNRQPYPFNGKELDLSTGLYHYGARSYETPLGSAARITVSKLRSRK